MTDQQRLLRAYEKVRYDLLSQREREGHWVGELATSALSTATAVSALTLIERHDPTDAGSGTFSDEGRESQLSEMIVRGLHWLADHQNPDGGWGDTELSYSNIATTMLVTAAFRLTGVPADHADLMQRAEDYIARTGGIAALRRRYGRDKTFAVPILTNCALAGIVPWREVSALPFEAACLPQDFYRFARLPVVSYAIPALVAIGQAKYFHQPPWNPLTRMIRAASVKRSLRVLKRIQPTSGGYLEAAPLTSFVVMSLAATGRATHRVAQRGVKFLIDSVRPDGSWPIDTNLAAWNTTLALNALAGAGEDIAKLDCLDWLLSCQYRERHPYTGAAPGGWGWSDLSGAVPDADDTPGALLALSAWRESDSCSEQDAERIMEAARLGIAWLLDLQNRDGGWPTFCRGWGKLPFDRSGADLTAHVLRALHAWREALSESKSDLSKSLPSATQRGLRYLERAQRDDGSWVPLWFGNQDHPQEENPVYGTAKVLLAYRDLGMLETGPARRGSQWLVQAQNKDGGWGGGAPLDVWKGGARRNGASIVSSVEETALALEALLAAGPSARAGVDKGAEWLMEAVETDRYQENAPIGFYFAKLWYHEKLYPRIFTLSALGQALRRSRTDAQATNAPPAGAPPQAVTSRLTNA